MLRGNNGHRDPHYFRRRYSSAALTLSSMRGPPRFIQSIAPWALCLFGTAVAFLAAHALGAAVPVSPLAAYVAGFVCVVTAVVAAGMFAPQKPRVVLPIAVAALVGIACAAWLSARPPGWPRALTVTLALLAAGSAFGALVGARIQQAGHLLFVALASALADLFSVVAPEGPSAAIAKSEVALSIAALAWPMIGSSGIEPFLGVGDVVFTALYLASTRRHGLSVQRSAVALACGYGLTMLVVVVFEVVVPALPFLGAAMLVAQPAMRRPKPADMRRGLVVLSVMTAVFLALLLRPHH